MRQRVHSAFGIQRVDALAHIISGDHVTELSRANAREMLGLAEHETGD